MGRFPHEWWEVPRGSRALAVATARVRARIQAKIIEDLKGEQ